MTDDPGFATSLAIVLAAMASAVLFGSVLTPAFLVGMSFVLGATWLYQYVPTAPIVAPTSAVPLEPIKADAPVR